MYQYLSSFILCPFSVILRLRFFVLLTVLIFFTYASPYYSSSFFIFRLSLVVFPLFIFHPTCSWFSRTLTVRSPREFLLIHAPVSVFINCLLFLRCELSKILKHHGQVVQSSISAKPGLTLRKLIQLTLN